MFMEPLHETKGTSLCGFYYSNLVKDWFGDNDCDLNGLSEAYNLDQWPRKKKEKKKKKTTVHKWFCPFGSKKLTASALPFISENM